MILGGGWLLLRCGRGASLSAGGAPDDVLDLPNLDPGQRVHIQRPTGHGHRQWDSQGQVVRAEDEGRKYLVKYDNGSASIHLMVMLGTLYAWA